MVMLTDYERERSKPPLSWNHGIVQARLIWVLAQHEREQYTGVSELDLDLGGLHVTPDVSIYPKLEIDYARDILRMTKPPLTAVWIANPTQPTQEVVDKIQDMLRAGVLSCWLAQPAMQTVSIYTADAPPRTVAEGTLTDPAVEGIAVDVTDVFA